MRNFCLTVSSREEDETFQGCHEKRDNENEEQKMKRLICAVLLVFMLLSNGSYAMDAGVKPIHADSADETRLIVNGESLTFSDYTVQPYDSEGIRMLPLRSIAENLGFTVSWNEDDQRIELKKGSKQFQLTIGKVEYVGADGELIVLDAVPELSKARTFVPSAFFSEVIGVEVIADRNQTILEGCYDYEFDAEDREIKGIVADVPKNYMKDNFYEYSYEIVDSFDQEGKAIQIIGNNHSDDMFIGFYRGVKGLEPNSEYLFKLRFDLGTNVPRGMMGIGGSPGTSVYVKAGFVSEEPKLGTDELNHIRFENVDKANQSQSGKDLHFLTNMEKASDDYTEAFEYKTIAHYFRATTDDNGVVFLLIGTDSGFEGKTEVYYRDVKLTVREATEYNLSTLPADASVMNNQ